MKYQSRQYRKEQRQQFRLRRLIILIIGFSIAAFGLVKLICYVGDLFSSRQTTQELREIARETDTAGTTAAVSWAELPTPDATPSPSVSVPQPEETQALSDDLPVIEYPNGYNFVPRIQKLRKKSKNIVGWITMDDLDEPVAQKDNTFFLNHDAMGKRNSNGAIFMDQGINLMTRPYTILLYGHNMKTGAMFGSLRKYEKFSYYYQHRIFQFDSLYEEGRYVVFAVSLVNLTPGRSKYLNLSAIQSTDRETRQNAINALIKCSMHDIMLDVNEEDQLLLLITCVGDDDERLIVAARRLRDGEKENSLTMKKQN